ncbi:hypothetical protein DIPPA_26881 [Diplonema papillatum]|nr:hypothetical protein DIPPA_26881 [Diplonema papillatum]
MPVSFRQPDFDACPSEIHQQVTSIAERYRLEDEIGDGAYSRVVAAKHLESGETRAIKIVPKAGPASSRVGQCLVDGAESQILAAVVHPSIVKLYEILETPNEVYYVFEKLPKDLFTVLYRRRRLEESEMKEMAKSLVESIDYLHSVDVVHRDIKLENVLVTDKGAVKLADFGYAKMVAAENRPVGTTFYQSPETLEAQESRSMLNAEQAKASDMYSLGVLLFFLFCGQPPYTGKVWPPLERKKLLQRITQTPVTAEDPRWPVTVSSDAVQFIISLLDPSWKTRTTSSDALAHPWLLHTPTTQQRCTDSMTSLSTPLVQCPA